MNKFNLTFWGEILAGRDPQKVKARFGKMFAIDDPERLEHFFSGDTIILRRNLERKVAAEYYSKLRKLGVEVKLVKVEPAHTASSPAIASGSAEEQDRKADWEKARQLAEVEALQRKAQRAAEREQARQRAEAAAARRRAEQDALKQQRAEAEARRREQEEIRRREQAEAEAQQRAELEARRQQQAREAAERKAAREEEKRRAAGEAARRKAELEEQKRLAREKADAEKARRAEEKRKAAEALAVQQAAEAEKKRLEQQQRKEQTARDKARREEEKRKAAEEEARKREQAAEKKRQEQQQRKEQAAREKARRKEEKRKAAEALAVQQAAEAEKKRREEQQRSEQLAREKAEREAEAARVREEQETARREEKAERDAERARVAAERARQRAEQQRRQAEEKRRGEEERRAELAREQEQKAQRKLMEEQAIARAAEELNEMSSLKTAQGAVKSSLDLPRRSPDSLPPKAKSQAGAPNFYSMHPFRSSSDARERAERARKKKFTGLVTAAVALAALLIFSGSYLERTPTALVTGPAAIAAAPSGALAILAGDQLLLHDRAGVGTEAVTLADRGIPWAVSPLTYNPSGELLLYARPGALAESFTQLHRCDGELQRCSPVPIEGHAQALVTHPLTGELFLAGEGRLAKLSPGGETVASTELPLPDQPVMLLDSGLLFINSSQGPAVSVFRYENSAFGKQLDEILLLPPPAVAQEQTLVRDFVSAGDNWWVSLENPETGSTGLYLFDRDWNYRSEATPGADWTGAKLLSWGPKVLLWRPDTATIKRFAASGLAEADLRSDLLDSLIQQRKRNSRLEDLAWAAGFCALLAIALIGASLGYHQYLRSLVYHSRPVRGAEPVDEHTENIHWIDPASDRAGAIRRLWISWGTLAAATVLLCIGLGVELYQLVAALIALAGPAVALALVERSQPAHVGTLEDSLVLVDHRQMYHLASGPRIQYRGPFLLIDDVVVFTGTPALPALSCEQFTAAAAPVAETGARVDRKTVLVKLLDARHPLARGATITAGTWLAALVLLAGGQFL